LIRNAGFSLVLCSWVTLLPSAVDERVQSKQVAAAEICRNWPHQLHIQNEQDLCLGTINVGSGNATSEAERRHTHPTKATFQVQTAMCPRLYSLQFQKVPTHPNQSLFNSRLWLALTTLPLLWCKQTLRSFVQTVFAPLNASLPYQLCKQENNDGFFFIVRHVIAAGWGVGGYQQQSFRNKLVIHHDIRI
jgi:hypothetical protein